MLVQYFLYCILQILAFAFCLVLRVIITLNNSNLTGEEDVGNTFDYVIVGGGSAGAIVAARLSENPNVSVVVVEAGGYGSELLNIPVLGPLKQLTELDWQHTTIPQKSACLGLENNVSRWPSGKILGGSTHLNYMIYLRGHENDFVGWKDSKSDHWSYEDISYYFGKGTRWVCSDEEQTDECRLKKGSILVRKNQAHATELSDCILLAASELNYTVSDLNGETNTGFMKPQLNMNEFGRRWTSDQYLERVRKERKNLKVITKAVARKILLRDGFEAHAVEMERNGRTETVHARQEIVVSAGAVGSPKLLMLSGIGPAEVLERAKIQQLIDLPAGRNLQDHVTTGLDLVLLDRTLFSFADLLLPSSALEYFLRGEGPFSSGMVEAVGVVHSRLSDPARDSPDLEFMVLLAGVSSDKGVVFRTSMGISEKVWDGYFKHLINESVVSILPVLLHPKSTGTVTLNPVDPDGEPRIDPRYLTEEQDVSVLVEGIRIVQKMVSTTPLRKLGAKFNGRKFPGCDSLPFDSDAYWRCYVRHLTLTVYHPVGTCKMAALTDGGVVDHSLRVHKTNKLRVIDASVMPTLPSANTNAAVVMIAEKGADLIKEAFNRRRSSCPASEIWFARNICR